MRLVRVAVTVLLVGTSLLAHLQAYGRWDVMPALWAGAGVVYQDPVANSWNYFKNLEAIKAIQYPNEVPFHDFTCAWSTHQVYCRIWTNGSPAGSGSGYYSSGYNVWCDNSQGWYPIQGSGTWDGPPPWPCLKKVVDSAPNPAKNAGNPPSCQGVFNPINSGTGNKVQQEVDYTDGAPLPLELVRSYNSQRSSGAATMGWNWRHGFERFLWRAGNVLVFMYRPDGRALQFDLINGAWRPESDAVGALTEVAGGYQYVNDRNQIENYDSAGRLTILAEPSGRSQKFEYTNGTTIPPLGARALDANGNPTTNAVVAGRLLNVADEFGRRIEFSYDLAGRMLRMTDPAGEIYQYAYDANNNLASVTYPDGKVRTYHYNEAAYTGGANLPNALTGLTDENGVRFATWGYDAQGRAISSEHAGGVEHGTLQYGTSNTVVTDPLGTQRTYNFTTILGVVKKTSQSQPGGAGCGPAANAITYDANGNIASRTDFNGKKTTYTYDPGRNLEVRRIEGQGSADAALPETRTITTAWHANWRLPTRIEEYVGASAAGNPVRRTDYAYDERSNVTAKAVTDVAAGLARNWSTTYTYSATVPGLVLRKVVDGPRTDVADLTTYDYHPHDEICAGAAPGQDKGCRGQLMQITNPLGQVTRFTRYNAHGQAEEMIDPNGLVTTLTYDLRQRLISRAIGSEVTDFQYDAAGQLVQLTLPNDSAIFYTYDNARRLTAVTDNLGNRIAYTLDAAGNRIREDILDPQGALVKSLTRSYDALGRLQALTGVTAE